MLPSMQNSKNQRYYPDEWYQKRDERFASLKEAIFELKPEYREYEINPKYQKYMFAIQQSDWNPLSPLHVPLKHIYFSLDELNTLKEKLNLKEICVTPRTDGVTVVSFKFHK